MCGPLYVAPDSPGRAFFEVEIEDPGLCTIVGVGVSPRGTSLRDMPGWGDGSVGFHADDGKVCSAVRNGCAVVVQLCV